jgi:phospholipase C
MDGFVTSRMAANPNDAVLAMGYYNRADIPYYYGLADAFTICDNYFCSVIGPTDPNRLYSMAASLDPYGTNGGPVLETIVTNRSAFYGKLTYTTMPEQLEARGITSKTIRTRHRRCINMLLDRSFPPTSLPTLPPEIFPRFPGWSVPC